MTASEPARKTSMVKGTIDMVVRIVTPGIMAHPLIIGMHMRSVGMPGLIDKSPVPLCRGLLGARRFLDPCRRLATLLTSGRRRTVGGNMSRTRCAIATATLLAALALRQSGERRNRHHE